ncbi:hypothetical protein MSAN_01868900 [Mycena sanguinolenta]|uniref:Transmembrane protein n=1 Tax=Mycena sanguinolenta TaxID=230812 RepID=A0A8H6XQZ2_9AGAR|nr:hypothetical protein MSAN_01868900 [Mycena sanguinolenta]
MSSTPFSSSSAFSSPKAVMCSAIQSCLVAFAINTSLTTKILKTGLRATPTTQVVLAPSPCIPVAGSLDRSSMAAVLYICVIAVLVAWILFAKTSNSAESPCTPSPNPEPPALDFDPVSTCFQTQDSAPNVAAAGAPPPPPPGNDTTCDHERHPKRSFLSRFFAFILGILFGIWHIFKWPIAFFLSIIFHYVILPIIVKEIGIACGVTPILASATGPYIVVTLKRVIDSSPTLRWLTLWGLAQCVCSTINAAVHVVSLVCETAIWAVGFARWRSSSICLRSIQSVLAVLRRIRNNLQRLWYRCQTFYEGATWLAFSCLFVVVAVFMFGLVTVIRLFGAAPPILQILRESEPWQTAVFWWDWILLPNFKSLLRMFREDAILFVGLVSVSMLVRWIVRLFPFPSKGTERAARIKLQTRIKMLEARL